MRLPEEAFRDSDRFTCKSRSLVDVTNGRNKEHMSKGHVVEPSEESEYQTVSYKKTNRSSEEIKWNFRRRDVSDRSSQPHSAPTEVAAQQSENFQRFYRAVVSPTHVRVTAGGRIVANTRASASPLFEWNGEKLHFETRKTEPDRAHHNLQPSSWQHSTAPSPGFPPLIPGGFLSPYSLLPRTNSITMAAMAPPVQPCPLANNSPRPPAGENAAASHQTNPLPQQIKISPPTQFDQTKPFMYNGHLVYPVQPGFQPPPGSLPVPVPTLGNAGFLPQNPMTTHTGFYPPQFAGTLVSTANPFIFPAGQQLPMGMPHGLQPLDNAPSLVPYMPFLTSPMVSITEIIRSQIQFLQSGLKQIEHQMSCNNKPRVDESFIEHQHSLVASQISNLEAILENQLAQEGAMSSLRGDEADDLGILVSSSRENSMRSLTSNNTIVTQPSKENLVSIGERGESVNPTAETESPQLEQSKCNKMSLARSDSTTKSRLTLAAAMAPPFQPRTQAAIAQASQAHLADESSRFSLTSPMENVPFETQAQIEARLLAKSSTDWGYGGLPAARTNVVFSRAESIQEQSLQRQNEIPPPAFQKLNTFHGESTIAPMSVPNISPSAVPYLVGKFPIGVPASQVEDSDFVYPRTLTQDEIRARFLYWGKAPRSVQSGLPKFDGKDFYPPSPVKEDAQLPSEAPSNSIHATIPQLNFEKLFDSQAPSSPERIASSDRIAQNSQVSIPNQPASFGTPDHDHYGLLPVRPSITGLSDWSTQDGRFEDVPQQPQTPSRPICAHNLVISPVTEDFSHLFLERGVPGYKSPSPVPNDTRQLMMKFEQGLVTPKHPTPPGKVDQNFETGRVESRMESTAEVVENDASSNNSSVELHLSPQNKTRSPRASHQARFVKRVENFRK
jgi:hypothetical protein